MSPHSNLNSLRSSAAETQLYSQPSTHSDRRQPFYTADAHLNYRQPPDYNYSFHGPEQHNRETTAHFLRYSVLQLSKQPFSWPGARCQQRLNYMTLYSQPCTRSDHRQPLYNDGCPPNNRLHLPLPELSADETTQLHPIEFPVSLQTPFQTPDQVRDFKSTFSAGAVATHRQRERDCLQSNQASSRFKPSQFPQSLLCFRCQ